MAHLNFKKTIEIWEKPTQMQVDVDSLFLFFLMKILRAESWFSHTSTVKFQGSFNFTHT